MAEDIRQLQGTLCFEEYVLTMTDSASLNIINRKRVL